MPPKEKQMIDLNTLDPQQLSMLKKEFEEELNGLMRSTMALQKAAGEFGASGQAVEALQEHREGQPVMLPLTSSVYVNGTLATKEAVLVDIGTGYYIEKSVSEGVDYCRRKVQFLKEQIDQFGLLIREKQTILTEIEGGAGQGNAAYTELLMTFIGRPSFSCSMYSRRALQTL